MDRSFARATAGRHTNHMMIRSGAVCAGLLLMLTPGLAQTKATPQAADTPQAKATPAPPVTAQPPASGPQELSHQEMVEEQERRDREEQAERDRRRPRLAADIKRVKVRPEPPGIEDDRNDDRPCPLPRERDAAHLRHPMRQVPFQLTIPVQPAVGAPVLMGCPVAVEKNDGGHGTAAQLSGRASPYRRRAYEFDMDFAGNAGNRQK